MACEASDLTDDSAPAMRLYSAEAADLALARAAEFTEACDAAAPERVCAALCDEMAFLADCIAADSEACAAEINEASCAVCAVVAAETTPRPETINARTRMMKMSLECDGYQLLEGARARVRNEIYGREVGKSECVRQIMD